MTTLSRVSQQILSLFKYWDEFEEIKARKQTLEKATKENNVPIWVFDYKKLTNLKPLTFHVLLFGFLDDYAMANGCLWFETQ